MLGTKEKQRAEIELQVQEYLDRGGLIPEVDHTANHAFRQPPRRTRKQQIEYRKRFKTSI